MTESLKSTNERQVVYALDMLSSVRTVDLTEHLVPLLRNSSHDVKVGAMTLLRSSENDTLQNDFEILLKENDPDIRLEAMRYQYFSAHDNRTMLMKTYLDQPDQVLRATALVCLSESAVPEELKLVDRSLFETLITVKDEQGIICRKYVARAIGNLSDSQYYDYLKNLLDDKSSEVVNEAILSIGRTQDRHFIPLLMDMLTTRRVSARKQEKRLLRMAGV